MEKKERTEKEGKGKIYFVLIVFAVALQTELFSVTKNRKRT